ncbi:MAG: hypothetical protein A2Y40_07280 [Candidatus Margulisbacteria bacterium GWF2_35_9]|nr:MAG: hypothetical protein A2Y40_07280 [Candidatus Margulisbacteria bacterium GWF2_35_9]
MKSTIGIAILISFLSFFFYSFDGFSTLDNKLYDRHFQKQLLQSQENSVMIVAIDDDSLNAVKEWPWSRKIFADVVNVLNKGKAKIIGFDINFDTYTKFNPIDNAVFNHAINAHKNVIMGRRIKVYNKKTSFLNPNNKSIQSKQAAILHQYYDSDYSVRRTSLLTNINNLVYPSFALEIATSYLGILLNSNTLSIQNNTLQIDNFNIPLDKQNKMLINYTSPTSPIPIIPLHIMLDPKFLDYNPKIFENKVVLIGATATELHDIYPTPISLTMEGIEIQANIIQSIINKKFIKTIPHLFYMLIIFIPSLIISIINRKLRIVGGFFSFILITYSLIVSSGFCFQNSYILNISAPIFSLLLTYLVSIIYRFLVEEKEKKEIKQAFNQYVSPNIVKKILSDKNKFSLSVEKKEASILFIDIRNFTSFSESHSPEEIVSQLNEFLDAMTEVIFAFDGTLDKFIGDSVMAVWGATIDQEDHALLAVQAGLRQLTALSQLQEKWKSEGKTILDVGIGICTGEVVAGNIGAHKYKDHTVIGDSVNLASIIQRQTREVTKERGFICRFLISDSTNKRVRDKIETEFIGEISLKGKKEKEKIWEVSRSKSIT